jgi:phasin family protein
VTLAETRAHDSAQGAKLAVERLAPVLQALQSPVRVIARSSVKLTSVSQVTVQNLIELQSEVVTAALNDVALRLERATRAENIIEFVREQIELTPATRARVVEDANRAVTIFKTAGRDFRSVAKHAVEMLSEKAKAEAAAAAKPVRRKAAAAKRATRALKRILIKIVRYKIGGCAVYQFFKQSRATNVD